MASKVIVELLDDVDGSTADDTVTFALDGVSYEIDLSSANSELLREALAPFVRAGRRLNGKRSAKVAASMPIRTHVGADAKTIRAWANATGVPVTARGRVSPDVAAQFAAAHEGREETATV